MSDPRPAADDLRRHQVVRGQRPGNVIVKLQRDPTFRRSGPDLLRLREDARRDGLLARLKHSLLGEPLATAALPHERLTKVKALAIFSSDAMSSVAYATEEIMKVAVLAGLGALSLTLPISFVIVLLLAIVAVSYRQTIRAYPSGGGSYIVAKENLGTIPGLVAAAALLIDYVLTVAVSVAAGVAAIVSAFPALQDWQIQLSVAAVVLISMANLRGVRESGTIFAAPTYVFIAAMYGLIAFGLYRVFLGGGVEYQAPELSARVGTESLGIFLLLAAFAQGCTAMTGTEAISNGVPAFKPPEAENARKTLTWMALILGTTFLGISFLAQRIGVVPIADTAENYETVVSQIARAITGTGPYYYLVQLSTALILVLAANTSFADFPRLGSILAKDRYLPKHLAFRGHRLAFSNGILALAGAAIALLILFRGSVDALIPLYAVGVFTAFTLSQSGMVRHWLKTREPGWRKSMLINGLGAVATGIVTVVIAFTKFEHGAWLVIVLIPLIIVNCLVIHAHYQRAERSLETDLPLIPDRVHLRAIVPIAALNAPGQAALAFARAISPNVTALHVTDDLAQAEQLRQRWSQAYADADNLRLQIIESPYRSLTGPLLQYIDLTREAHPTDTITVVLPEFVPNHWWEQPLHNQTTLVLKAALLFRRGVVTVNVPYHMAPSVAKR
jgi:amino acid transporter